VNTHNSPSNKEDSIIKNLRFMKVSDTLKMYFHDKKCGEWGGNTNTILVYKIYNKQRNRYYTFMDVTQRTMNCDSVLPENIKRITFQKKHIIVNDYRKKLLYKSIHEITQNYLTKKHRQLSNTGSFSGISTSDNSFLIRIYPSPPWESFFELIEEVKM
jgi:hypothetical protein